jgi:1,2-diacylglycerol 3-alpha-glucosyltransferase
MSKMARRIVLVTEIIAPYRIPVFNALALRADLDLHVIFLAETDETLRKWHVHKDEIRFPYEVLRSWRWRVGKGSLLITRGLRAALDRSSPQVIICGGYADPAAWQTLLWARHNETEFVLWSESNRFDARAKRSAVERLKKYFVRHCDRYVVPGKAASDYLKSLGAPAASIYMAPNAVDNVWFAQQAGNARSSAEQWRRKLNLPSRFLLFVGRFVPEKGVLDLLSAYARLKAPRRTDVGLVFAGDGLAREELMRKANEIIPGQVCFPGFAQREELAILYALADFLVLPTHSDPWGLVVNEAMACGLPIIVTNVAGCSLDLVQNGSNGYVVPPRDSEKLSAAIETLLENSETRQKMGARSLQRIQSNSPEACAEGLAAAAFPAAAEVL